MTEPQPIKPESVYLSMGVPITLWIDGYRATKTLTLYDYTMMSDGHVTASFVPAQSYLCAIEERDRRTKFHRQLSADEETLKRFRANDF